MTHEERVRQFMDKAYVEGKADLQFVPGRPTIPCLEIRKLRAKLILEEALETITGLGFICVNDRGLPSELNLITHPKGSNIIEVADGCCDLHVVTTGTMLSYGIDQVPIQKAIDESNLAKFSGNAHAGPDGKWIKPSGWQPPDLAKLILKQGYRP